MRISLVGMAGVSALEKVLQENEEKEEKDRSAVEKRTFAENLAEELNDLDGPHDEFKVNLSSSQSPTISLHCSLISDYPSQEYSVEINFSQKIIAFSPAVKTFEVDFTAEKELDKLLEIAEDHASAAKNLQEIDDLLRGYSRSQGFSYRSPLFYDSPGQLGLPEMEPPARSLPKPQEETAKISPDHDYFAYLKKAGDEFIDVLEKALSGYIHFSPALEQGRLLLTGEVPKKICLKSPSSQIS